MNARISVGLETRAAHRIPADVLVVPFWIGENLRQGPIAWADWRMCGLLSKQIRAAKAAALPAPLLAPSGGRLGARWVVAFALPEHSAPRQQTLRTAGAEIVQCLFGLEARSIVLVAPLAVPVARSVEALGRGLAAGVSAAAAAAAGEGAALSVRFAVAEEERHDAEAGLSALVRWAGARDIFSLAPAAPSGRRRVRPSA